MYYKLDGKLQFKNKYYGVGRPVFLGSITHGVKGGDIPV